MATVEELQKKLKDAVKQYEGKLAAISALNSALQKENDQLRDELDEATQPKTAAEADALELKQEFARRLGEQQRQIDVLKDTNLRLQAKLRDKEADSTSAGAQLTTLHEKLSKQQQDHAQLSAKASGLEKSVRKLNHRIKELEHERDKHISRAQVLHIQLTEAQQSLASAGQAASLKLQAVQQEHQQALAAAKQQHGQRIAELQQQLAAAKDAAAAGNEQAAAAAAEREATMSAALSEARAAVQSMQDQQAESEQRHRRAVQRLQAQIQQLELEKQGLLSDSGDASTSLMRQIQALAAQASAAQASAAEQEQLLMLKLHAAEQAAAEAAAAERDAAGRAASAEAALEATKEAAAAAVQDCVGLRSRLEAAQRHNRTLEAERNGAQDRLAAAQAREEALKQDLQQQQRQAQEQLWETTQKLQQLSREREELFHKLQDAQQLYAAASDRARIAEAATPRYAEVTSGVHSRDTSRRGSTTGALHMQLAGLAALAVDGDTHNNIEGAGLDAAAGSASASQQNLASMGFHKPQHQQQQIGQGLASVLDGSNSLQLHQSGPLSRLSSGSSSPRGLTPRQQQQQQLYGTYSKKASVEAVLQLQRAVQQLQQELATAVQERDAAQEQLYQAVRQADAAAAAAQQIEKLNQEQKELQQKLEVAMEIIGERSLRIEELEADILDMKAIFHTQLEAAVEQLHALQQQQQQQLASDQQEAEQSIQ